jgi:hypothetical protein
MSESDYPEIFLKGAPSGENLFDSENNVMPYCAWEHWDGAMDMEGFEESSINWMDDEGAEEELRLKMTTRKGKPQRQFIGCFVLSTEELQKCVSRHQKLLDYGRRPLDDNRYHGNIYRKKDMPKSTKTTLASQLCNAFLRFIDFKEAQQ